MSGLQERTYSVVKTRTLKYPKEISYGSRRCSKEQDHHKSQQEAILNSHLNLQFNNNFPFSKIKPSTFRKRFHLWIQIIIWDHHDHMPSCITPESWINLWILKSNNSCFSSNRITSHKKVFLIIQFSATMMRYWNAARKTRRKWGNRNIKSFY